MVRPIQVPEPIPFERNIPIYVNTETVQILTVPQTVEKIVTARETVQEIVKVPQIKEKVVIQDVPKEIHYETVVVQKQYEGVPVI